MMLIALYIDPCGVVGPGLWCEEYGKAALLCLRLASQAGESYTADEAADLAMTGSIAFASGARVLILQVEEG